MSSNNKILFQCLLVLSVLGFLNGCASNPELLGVSPAEWSNYGQDQQSQLLDNYYKIQNLQQAAVAISDRKLAVKVYNGTMLMEPSAEQRRYAPLDFTITEGTCKDIDVRALEDKDNATVLTACYRDKTLFFDPSRYDVNKAYGTISLRASPFWDDGFTYQGLKSTGYVKMDGVSVIINGDKLE